MARGARRGRSGGWKERRVGRERVDEGSAGCLANGMHRHPAHPSTVTNNNRMGSNYQLPGPPAPCRCRTCSAWPPGAPCRWPGRAGRGTGCQASRTWPTATHIAAAHCGAKPASSPPAAHLHHREQCHQLLLGDGMGREALRRRPAVFACRRTGQRHAQAAQDDAPAAGLQHCLQRRPRPAQVCKVLLQQRGDAGVAVLRGGATGGGAWGARRRRIGQPVPRLKSASAPPAARRTAGSGPAAGPAAAGAASPG